ncbi:MAG: tetratricopeptide repeat protein [Nitrospinaceae bacterium]
MIQASLSFSATKRFLRRAAIGLAFALIGNTAPALEVNKGAVVLLLAKGAQGEVVSTGTGFVVDPAGILLTNYHVLVDAASMEAVFRDKTRVPVKGIRAVDKVRDFSILQLEGDLFSSLEVGDSSKVKEYAFTSALGYPAQGVEDGPNGATGRLVQTFGFVLGVLPQALPGLPLLYTTTPLEPGFSGGPVLDRDNKVVGLATIEGRALNLAIPINDVKPHFSSKHLKTFAQLLEEDKNSKEALYYRGNFALYAMGEPAKAVDYFERSLAKDPNFVPARYDLAVAYRGLGKTDAAINEYIKALKFHPRFPEALSNLGGQYFRQGDTAKAIGFFRQAVDVFPNFVQGLSNLGAALNKKGKYAEATPYLKRALDLDPEFGVALFNLGNSQYGMNHFQEAEKTFGAAVRMGLDFLSLHWKLADIFLRQDRRQEAIQELELILEMDPLNKEASDRLLELKNPPG